MLCPSFLIEKLTASSVLHFLFKVRLSSSVVQFFLNIFIVVICDKAQEEV